MSTPGLADPQIQAQLQAEAMQSASGGLVWDEDRRYIAANEAACRILGTTPRAARTAWLLDRGHPGAHLSRRNRR
jgi:PAS domain-containing protein